MCHVNNRKYQRRIHVQLPGENLYRRIDLSFLDKALATQRFVDKLVQYEYFFGRKK